MRDGGRSAGSPYRNPSVAKRRYAGSNPITVPRATPLEVRRAESGSRRGGSRIRAPAFRTWERWFRSATRGDRVAERVRVERQQAAVVARVNARAALVVRRGAERREQRQEVLVRRVILLDVRRALAVVQQVVVASRVDRLR